MPTIARMGPYRVFLTSIDGYEPPHVHFTRDDAEAKFWLQSVDLAKSDGFPPHELNKMRKLVVEHQQEWLEEWYKFHGNRPASY
jgi:hypothetical protein